MITAKNTVIWTRRTFKSIPSKIELMFLSFGESYYPKNYILNHILTESNLAMSINLINRQKYYPYKCCDIFGVVKLGMTV